MNKIGTMYLSVMDRVNAFISFLLSAMLCVMVIVIFSQVFNRYILESSIRWSEELARYLMVWGVFLGAAYAMRRGMLIAVKLLPEVLPEKLKKVLHIGVHILAILFCMFLLFYGTNMALKVAHQTSPAMGLSMAVPYFSIPVGSTLMLLNTIAAMLDMPKGNEGVE